MSTVQRRRGKSLHLELPGGSPDDKPQIAALFLIRFDVKAGYTIAWKKSLPDLALSDSVEFKSLPSGLHNVKEDLVYFMHDDDHAGISAFVNKSTDQWERNALMLAVGVLVPLDNGRLGKSWKHADTLKELAKQLVLDPSKVKPLEDYWSAHQVQESRYGNDSRPVSSSGGSGAKLQESVITDVPIARMGLSPYHPALTLPSMVDSFGPLIFPLYKAALLRKRILLMHEAPVQLACNFVYNISLLSNIPSSVVDLIPLEPLPTRLQPLFSIGIHDIDELSYKGRPDGNVPDPGYGWIACSTDDVLTIKTDIYDILVNIPPENTNQASCKVWPQVRNAVGQELKASQRDLRRYRTLRQSIQRHFPNINDASPLQTRSKDLIQVEEVDDETATFLTRQPTTDVFQDTRSTNEEKLIEPMSWAALAYNSFMWWASAGEQTSGIEEEIEHDSSMFRDFNSSYADGGSARRSFSGSGRRSSTTLLTGTPAMTDGSMIAPEMAIIAFFHRLTANIFTNIAKAIENSNHFKDDNQDEPQEEEAALLDEEEPQAVVYIGGEDLTRMGLDIWSDVDKKFVEDVVELYWGRKADVQGGTIDCCGVRII